MRSAHHTSPMPSLMSPAPTPPRAWTELAEGVREGPLYWHVGAGLSVGAGLPRWDQVVEVVWKYLEEYEAGADA